MSITISAVVTEFGAYYQNNRANQQQLMKKLMQKSETEKLFQRRITKDTRLEFASADFADVLQRFQKAWTPKGGVTFTPNKIELYRQKIDLAESPDDLMPSWLGFLTSDDLDRKTWPFVRWWLESNLQKATENLEKNEIFGGVPGTITPGTATAAGTNMLGIRKILNDGITAGTINEIAVGAAPTDPEDFVDYVEEFVAGIPELIRSEIDIIVTSPAQLALFRSGMRKKYNVNWGQVDELETVIDTTLKVVGVASHAATTKLWATPKWNRIVGIKAPQNEGIFRVENVDRLVKAYTDWDKGVGFQINPYVYSTDVDKV